MTSRNIISKLQYKHAVVNYQTERCHGYFIRYVTSQNKFWIFILVLFFTSCNSQPDEKTTFLETIKNEKNKSNITEDHFYRLKIFHKYMNDNSRLEEIQDMSILSIQDKYNYFIMKKGRLKRHELAHSDFLISSEKEIINDSIVYTLEYENRTMKEITNMQISINTYSMDGELFLTSTWQCQYSNCLDGFQAKLPSSVLEKGMKISESDKQIYGLEMGKELNLSRFDIKAIEINYQDDSNSRVGKF